MAERDSGAVQFLASVKQKPWYKQVCAALLAIPFALGITAGAAKAESKQIFVLQPDGTAKPMYIEQTGGNQVIRDPNDPNKTYIYSNGRMLDGNNSYMITNPPDEQKRPQYQQPEQTTPNGYSPQQQTQQDDYQRKIAEYAAMIRQDPTNAKLYIQKVDEMIRNKLPPQEIIYTLESALNKKLKGSKKELAKIHWELAINYNRKEKYKKALPHL